MNDYKKILTDLLSAVIKEGSSDLHLAEGRHPVIRVSGSLIPLVKYPVLTKDDTLGLLNELLTDKNRQLFSDFMEVDFSYSLDNYRFRGNAFLQKGSIAIALRLISNDIKSFKELNLPNILEAFADRKQGFFLVVGPVGSGKSTTLAAMIDHINSNRTEHILTIEDPIEYIYNQKKSLVNQREVRLDTNDFSVALRSMFREDVNVVLIGEMRNLETISTAVTAAETGHLVFSTLHTNSASQTIDRIIDSFPGSQQDQIRMQLSNSLNGIFSQRLIPRISGGMIPAYELLINNSAVSNLIREKRTHELNTVIETSSQEGMVDMNRCLANLVSRGEISTENAYKFSPNPRNLERLL